jgi:hypothetical protein
MKSYAILAATFAGAALAQELPTGDCSVRLSPANICGAQC